MLEGILGKIQGGIVVSCQAAAEDVTCGPEFMVAFAKSAQQGGAKGIRANGGMDIRAIKAATGLPVIGIWKRPSLDEYPSLITPSVEDARLLNEAGADIVAVDATRRPRPGNIDAPTLIRRIKSELGIPLLADCSCLEDALHAQEAGADAASTTLAFPPRLGEYEPNLELLCTMVSVLGIPVIAEGRFWEPDDVCKAFAIGAAAVVVGSAITRPWLITRRYVQAADKAGRRA